MGAACCVAAKDRTIHHGSSGEIVHRNIRHSPSWSFRKDSRVGVTGEDTSIGWLSDVTTRSDTPDVKSVHVSDGSSSLERYQTGTQPKSPLNHETSKNFRSLLSDQSTPRNTSEVKTESPQLSIPASLKQSPSIHTSPLRVSPLSPQSNPLPSSPIPSRWAQNSPTHAFSDLLSASQRERSSVDSEPCSLACVKLTRTGGQNSGSSADSQTCGVCCKFLSEESAWSSQKMVAGNDLSVVSVLICGHVYHSECLDTITPEIYKYDPACPVCTFGEKQTLKLAVKMAKAEKDLKARKTKMSRNQAVYTDGSFDFDYGKSPKLKTSSSLKISSAKPFLKRHFSFGSSGNKFGSDSRSVKMKGLFWAKSSRE